MTKTKFSKAIVNDEALKILFEENPISMFIQEQGRVVNVNKSFKDITGYTLKAVLGKTLIEIGLLDQKQQDDLDVLESKDKPGKRHKIEIRRQDGATISGFVSKTPIRIEDKTYFLVTLINRTEVMNEIQKRQEIEVFFDLSPNLIATTDAVGRFMKTNNQWKNLLGHQTKTLNQSRFIDFVHPDDLMKLRIVLKNLSKVENLELRYRKSDGTYLNVEWNIRKVDKIIHYNGKDITKRVKAFDALGQERELFKKTVHSLNEAVMLTDLQGSITLMNPLAETYTGWVGKEALGHPFDEVFVGFDLIDRKPKPNVALSVIATDQALESTLNYGLLAKDGTERYILCRANPLHDQLGNISGAIITFLDSTQSRELETEIEAFLNVNLDILCVSEKTGYFYKVNKRFEEVLGYSAQEIEGKPFIDFIVEDDKSTTLNALSKLQNNKTVSGFTNRYRCKDGTVKYIEWHSQPGLGRFDYSSARDVTDRYLTEVSLRDQINHDPLTGIFNRRFFQERGLEEVQRSQRSNQPLSIIMFDIDHFKDINDTFGHPVGDLVLKDIAQITQNTIRNTDLFFRVGGEEFVVLTLDTPLYGARKTAEKILERLRQNVHPIVGNYTASFGVCEKLSDETMNSLYERVDAGLYRAKHNGRNQVVCDQVSSEKPIARIEFTFKPEWESGNAKIDAQHQSMIVLANQIINMPPHEFEKISGLIEKLIKDITLHFQDEEAILSRIGYPQLDQHQSFHVTLLNKAYAIKNENVHQTLKATSFFSFIVDELVIGHIIKEDQKFFTYLTNSGNEH